MAEPHIAVIARTTEPLENLKLHPRNARRGNVPLIAESLKAHGQYRALVVNRRTGFVVAGNHTLKAMRVNEAPDALVDWIDVDDEEELRILTVDNAASDDADYDVAALAGIVRELAATPTGLYGTGHTDDSLRALVAQLAAAAGDAPGPQADTGRPEGGKGPTLADRFLVPPFTVLDARQGYWQARKREWIAIGIRSEIGRDSELDAGAQMPPAAAGSGGMSDQLAPRAAQLVPGGAGKNSARRADPKYAKRGKAGPLPGGGDRAVQAFGDKYEGGDAYRGAKTSANSYDRQARLDALQSTGSSVVEDPDGTTGTSIFDPVLTELALRWFSRTGARVLDPFAGGSVRGVVSAILGRHYEGIELRAGQVGANLEQHAAILGPRILSGAIDGSALWHVGDSRELLKGLPPASYDLVLSCPPYADLERYSNDPRDLSAMDYPAFLKAYQAIIAFAVANLKPDRFAVWVVGEVRAGGEGMCRGLVPDTIAAFEQAGAALYNDAVLITAVGSLPVRSGRIFQSSRKLGRGHQAVLVFCKGSPRAAADWCGVVEVPEAIPGADGAAAENTG